MIIEEKSTGLSAGWMVVNIDSHPSVLLVDSTGVMYVPRSVRYHMCQAEYGSIFSSAGFKLNSSAHWTGTCYVGVRLTIRMLAEILQEVMDFWRSGVDGYLIPGPCNIMDGRPVPRFQVRFFIRSKETPAPGRHPGLPLSAPGIFKDRIHHLLLLFKPPVKTPGTAQLETRRNLHFAHIQVVVAVCIANHSRFPPESLARGKNNGTSSRGVSHKRPPNPKPNRHQKPSLSFSSLSSPKF